MSLHLPSRQACRTIPQSLASFHKSRTSPGLILYSPQRRAASVMDYFKRKNKTPEPAISLADLLAGKKPEKPKPPTLGSLGKGSIFDDGTEKDPMQDADKEEGLLPKDPYAMAAALNPNPRKQLEWRRRRARQQVKTRGRISRTAQLLKTERHHQYSSEFFETSVKKLMPLARQIAGKTIEDALIQLRFSKKKAAVKVAEELEIARDEAVVSAGMGLGHVRDESKRNKASSEAFRKPVATLEPTKTDVEANDESLNGSDATKLIQEEAVQMIEKNGRKRMVKPSTIYIDQAWVNKGKARRSLSFRAKGRTDVLTHRFTSISFLLKEEKTRLRRSVEREEKNARARPWLHHPDRNIPHQRQYIMW